MAYGRKATEAQKEAAAAKREAFAKLSERIGDMTEQEKESLCSVIIRKNGGIKNAVTNNAYSLNNMCMIVLQCAANELPFTAAGFNQWEKIGRKVRKGAKGKAVWLFCDKKAKNVDGDAGEVSSALVASGDAVKPHKSHFFRLGYVFLLEDTEPIEGEISENNELAMPSYLPSQAMAIRPSHALALV